MVAAILAFVVCAHWPLALFVLVLIIINVSYRAVISFETCLLWMHVEVEVAFTYQELILFLHVVKLLNNVCCVLNNRLFAQFVLEGVLLHCKGVGFVFKNVFGDNTEMSKRLVAVVEIDFFVWIMRAEGYIVVLRYLLGDDHKVGRRNVVGINVKLKHANTR